jgi:hypothetical protein
VPANVAAPVAVLTRYSADDDVPAVVAYAVPSSTMSKPLVAVKSTPSGPTVVSVPSLGGVYITSAFSAESMPYRVDEVAPRKLFV